MPRPIGTGLLAGARRVAMLVLLLALACTAPPAGAVQPDEVLPDATLEARAREISRELRCLVCQNQSIDDSNAGLARDLRILVRQRLVAGDSDDGVRAFVVARYGDYVLLRPPFNPATWGLWLGPPILFLGAGLAVAVWLRRRPASAAAPLSDAEQARLDRLVRGDGV
jgi:cytochrome c-type biogenesis protein CcmH